MTGRMFMVLLVAIVGLASAAEAETPAQETEAFRAKHERDYRREYVPLSGLFFLKPGANAAGSAKTSDILLPARVPASVGRFVYKDRQVTFEPAPGAGVTMKGKPVTAPVALASDEKSGPDELTLGDLTLWVHVSGLRDAIRVSDPQSRAATSFSGFRWFPIDGRYRVVGKFVKDRAPRDVRVPNLLGDDEIYTTEGVVEFTLNGQALRMRPMTTRPGRLYFTFRDGSSGHETYAAARFLYADLKADGTAVLDFNQAYNPPCAFNEFTTCPLPLPENRLTVKILAGERAYAGPHK